MVQGKYPDMELDTGASVSVMEERRSKETFPGVKIVPSKVVLRGYFGDLTSVQLCAEVWTMYSNRARVFLPLFIIHGASPMLVGRN